MRAVVKTEEAPGAEFETGWPDPEPADDGIVIEVAAASVCGTDRELYAWTESARAFSLTPPVVLGHEVSGTVCALGAEVTSLAVGDRVALESHVPCGHCFPCRTGAAHNCANLRILGMHLDGGFAEYVAAPQRICVALPDGVSAQAGALLEPAGVAMHALQRYGEPLLGRVALISGCGPVGLVIARLCMLEGAAHVVVSEPNAYRRSLAESAGAHAMAPDEDPAAHCREVAGDRGGADVAFEASAAPGVYEMLLDAVRREGTVIGVGHPGAPTSIDLAAAINKKGITLRGIFGRRLWSTWEAMLALVQSGQLDLEALVTHRLALDALPEAIELLDGEACKVLLDPSLQTGATP